MDRQSWHVSSRLVPCSFAGESGTRRVNTMAGIRTSGPFPSAVAGPFRGASSRRFAAAKADTSVRVDFGRFGCRRSPLEAGEPRGGDVAGLKAPSVDQILVASGPFGTSDLSQPTCEQPRWNSGIRRPHQPNTVPVLAVGDGALGFWKTVREVFPATREQRCWFHKQANVLAALTKSGHPAASAINGICNAEDIVKAQVAIKAVEIDYGAKYPKAVAKVVDDADVLLEFDKYPAEHWIHLRTTNPIESTFATVRLRPRSPRSRTVPAPARRQSP